MRSGALVPVLLVCVAAQQRRGGCEPASGLSCGLHLSDTTLSVTTCALHCVLTMRLQVSFYMRKGADLLSKWVGEAEKQLRLLFEEASKHQPAIIFFDEIDGLAPVRLRAVGGLVAAAVRNEHYQG
jgi:SpoVK/Ycf46/Vps4 family AAA+-type ATPase